MIPPSRSDTSGRFSYGWFVLAAASGMNFVDSATAVAVLTVFIVPLSTGFGWRYVQIAAVASVGAHARPASWAWNLIAP